MGSKIIFIAVALTLAVQIINVRAESQMTSCYNKMQDQFKKMDFTKMPSCYDVKKLEAAKQSFATLKGFLDKLQGACKSLTQENISQCIDEANTMLTSDSSDIQMLLVDAFLSIFHGGKKCVDDLIKQIRSMDMSRGCN